MRVDVDFSGPLRTFSANVPGGCGAAGEGGSMSSEGECPQARSAGVRVGCGASGFGTPAGRPACGDGSDRRPPLATADVYAARKRSVREKSRDGVRDSLVSFIL